MAEANQAFKGKWLLIQKASDGYFVWNHRLTQLLGTIRKTRSTWWFKPGSMTEYSHDCLADLAKFMATLK